MYIMCTQWYFIDNSDAYMFINGVKKNASECYSECYIKFLIWIVWF